MTGHQGVISLQVIDEPNKLNGTTENWFKVRSTDVWSLKENFLIL